MRRRIHDPERSHAKWGGIGLTVLWVLVSILYVADLPRRNQHFHASLEGSPLMWGTLGSVLGLVPSTLGLLLVLVYCYLPSGISKRTAAIAFGLVLIATFALTSIVDGVRGRAIYADKVVYRSEGRGSPLLVSYFRDLEGLEIGCASFRRRGNVEHSLVYRLKFQDGHATSLSSGGWNVSRQRRLSIMQQIHRQSLENGVPVRVARAFGGTGAPLYSRRCMEEVLNDERLVQRSIIREFFDAMPTARITARL